jgi:outer membrane protein OmpA-like peptidoglycan-associated protein
VRINLESAVDAFVIIVQDSESKQLVENSKVIFVGKDGVLVPSKYNQKTGEWKFELEKDKEYQLSITAPNYVSIDETFIRPPSKLISKSLKKMEQSIFYKAVDALTKRPITANYKVTKPDQSVITGTSDATKQFTVNMKPQLTYSIEIGAEGYKSITEKINFSIDLKPEKIIELSRDSYPLTLKVIDNETKKVISNSKITVINQTSNQPLISKNNANGVFTEDFIHSNIYQAEFESEGYIKANQKINVVDILNKSNGEVELILTKIPVEKYKIIAINENDSKKVTSADLRIFNNQNQPVPVSLNPSEMEWLVELKKEDSYSVEVKAQGFLAYKSNLEIVKGTITIKLKPIPSQEVIINVFDALTKKPITANYKLNSGNESIPGSVSNGSSKFNMNLLQDKNYDLEVNSNGYKSYKEAVKVNKEGKNEFNIDLKKEFYTFNFKAIDSKTNKSIGKVSLKIINDKDKQSLTPKFEQSSNEFVSNLASDNTYSAEFEANGYNKNSLKIDVNALARNSEFNKELLLEPVIIEPKVEPKKEEPKKELEPKNVEVKITTPKEEPKKEEPKKEEPKKETPKPNPPVKKEEKRVVDDAIVIEETELSVKVEVYENLVVGKRYRLGSVLFEQGTPTLKPKSNLQLEKLVRTLKLNPKLKIEVTGHTDNVGDARLNQILSEQRATKIGNYLFNGGIAENRIISIGKGQEEPIAPNDNELNKAKNRRVEFVLKDK